MAEPHRRSVPDVTPWWDAITHVLTVARERAPSPTGPEGAQV